MSYVCQLCVCVWLPACEILSEFVVIYLYTALVNGKKKAKINKKMGRMVVSTVYVCVPCKYMANKLWWFMLEGF